MVKWSFKQSHAAENASVDIYTTRGTQPRTNCKRCNVTGDQNGFSVLSFNATTKGDGGRYICVVDRGGKEARYGAELIVFGECLLQLNVLQQIFL